MKSLKIAAGFALVAAGAVMLITPGPGWVAIRFGLSMLAPEYAWARRWRDRIRDAGKKVFHVPQTH